MLSLIQPQRFSMNCAPRLAFQLEGRVDILGALWPLASISALAWACGAWLLLTPIMASAQPPPPIGQMTASGVNGSYRAAESSNPPSPLPMFSISNALPVLEGDSGTTQSVFTVTLSRPEPGFEWVRQFGGTGAEVASDLTTDPQGNLYVAGTFSSTARFENIALTSNGGQDIFLVKLDPSGHVLWAENFGGPQDDAPVSLVADGAGNLLLSGTFAGKIVLGATSFRSAEVSDGFLVKLDSNGSALWQKQSNGGGSSVGFVTSSDRRGNVYQTAAFSTPGGFLETYGQRLLSKGGKDAILFKLDSNGNVSWFQTTSGTGDESGQRTAVDSAGQVYLSGEFSGRADLGGIRLTSRGAQDVFLAALDQDGHWLWATQAGGAGTNRVAALALSAEGRIYQAGTLTGSATFDGINLTSQGNRDLYVAAYDSSGHNLWAEQFGGTANDVVNDLVLDQAGNIILVGSFSGTTSFGNTTLSSLGNDDLFVACLSPDGQCRWAKRAGGPGLDRAVAAIADASGHIYLTGRFTEMAAFGDTTLTSAGDTDLFVAKLAWPQPTVSVDYITSDGSALAGQDYLATKGLLTFGPDVTTQTISVAVQADTDREMNETFFVTLSNPSNAAIQLDRGVGLGTISNDDTNVPPVLLITSPADSSRFTAGESIPISVQAGDPDGTVTGVDFYANGQQLGSASTTPFSFDWRNVPAGTYVLTAQARDNAGAVATSEPVNITVAAKTPPLITPIVDQTTRENTTVPAIPFAVQDAETLPADLQLTALSSNPELLPPANILFTGAGTNRVLALIPAAHQSGAARVTIVVADSSGLSASTSFQLNVLSNKPPQVVITNPGHGAVFLASAEIRIAANATDSDGAIAKVEFYEGSTRLGETGAMPYSLAWTGAPLGKHWLTAVATDDQGAIGTSVPVEMAVADLDCSTPAAAGGTNTPSPQTEASDPEVFFGQDVSPYPPFGLNQVPRPGTIPNSDRAAATFLARLPGVVTETFEGFEPGSVPAQLTFGTNTVTVSGGQAIVEVVDPTATNNGEFPVSGKKGLELVGNSGTGFFALDFSVPQAAFGFYATDMELNGLKVTLVGADGTNQVFTVPVTLPQGTAGALFWGVIDSAHAFVRIELTRTRSLEDGFLFDNLTIATPAQLLPEAHWPLASISDADPVPEGNSGETPMTFSVRLSGPATNTVTVEYFTLDGTAQAGSDYTATNGLVTFQPGQTNLPLVVQIRGDSLVEADETVRVRLRNPSNALLGRCEAMGTVVNDDRPNTPPTISAIPDQVTKENTPTMPIRFTVGDAETSASQLAVTVISSNPRVVPNVNLVLSGTSADRSLVATPAADEFGETTITLTVTDADRLTTTAPFKLAVLAVNHPPTFTKGPDQVVADIAGPQSLAGWATNLSAGPANEVSQTLSFEINIDRPGLFASPPAVSASGTLTFTPAVGANGLTTVTLRLKDSGGTANGGADTSGPQTFTITVVHRNQPPTLSPIASITIPENSPVQTVALLGISAGLPVETQKLSISALSDNPTLIPDPVVQYTNPSSTGTLTFTPVPGVNGLATITVTVQDDGGTDNGGQDTIRRSFKVTVTPLPTLSINDLTILEGDSGTQAAVFTVSLSAPSAQLVSVSFRTADGSAVAPGDYQSAQGTLSFERVEFGPDTGDGTAGTLLAQRLGNEVALAWPATPAGCELQVTDSLAVGERWRPVTNSPVRVDQEYRFNAPIAGSSQFYRLFRGAPFSPGATTQTITVLISGDQANEADEQFYVDLINPINARILKGRGIGVIKNDDPLPTNAVNQVPIVRITSPENGATYLPGSDIIITADAADPDGTVARVDFYAGGNLIAGTNQAPWTVTWSKVATLGDYSLVARATDNRGAVADSGPVRVKVANVVADVAIIRNSADLEIAAIQAYLFDLGLTYYVFDEESVTFDALKDFKLAIWDDLGKPGGSLRDKDVEIFQQVFEAAIPIYFIGEWLASAGGALTEPYRTRWQSLIHLHPAASHGGNGNGMVSIITDSNHRVVNGRFGFVADFAYPGAVDQATQTGDESVLLARAGDADVLLAYEDPGRGVRTVTQNLLVADGTMDEQSIAERRRLFLNSVWWLLRRPICGLTDLAVSQTASPDPVPVGQELTYVLTVQRSGECEGTGVIVTDTLPTSVTFVSATAPQGTWSQANGVVTFHLGLLEEVLLPLTITVTPTRSGEVSNSVEVRCNEREQNLENNSSRITTQVGGN